MNGSKSINSKNVTIEFELKTNYPSASAYSQISLSSGLIENRIMLYPLSDTSVGITLTVDGASIVTGIKTCPSLSADYVAFKIEVTESAYTCSANGSIIHNQDLSTDPSFEVDTLKYFKLSGPLSGYPFKGEIRNLKIS